MLYVGGMFALIHLWQSVFVNDNVSNHSSWCPNCSYKNGRRNDKEHVERHDDLVNLYLLYWNSVDVNEINMYLNAGGWSKSQVLRLRNKHRIRIHMVRW